MQRKWYTHDSVQAGPEGTSKLHEDVAQMPRIPSPALLSCLMESSTQSVDTEETVKSGFQMVLHDMQASCTLGSYSTPGAFWEICSVDRPSGSTQSSPFWKDQWPDM